MRQNVATLRKNCKQIEKMIEKRCVDPKGKGWPIYDGIFDIATYHSEQMRILWILKEPYDEPDSSGGGWSFAQAFRKNGISFAKSRTFQPIIYVSYGILNGFLSYDQMDDITDDPEMAQVLKRIAFINVKKLPGSTSTPWEVLEEAYDQNRDILLKQIETCEPNVVIGGNTLSYFSADLGMHELEKHDHKVIVTYSSKDRIYVDAYHPVQTQYSREMYVDSITNAVKAWWKKYRK